MKKKLYVISLSLLSLTSYSQVSETDAADFLEAYFSPIPNTLSAGLNNGWYNTAQPHKLGGFDITVTLNTISFPETELTFDPNSINNFSSSSNATPTIFGSGNGSNIDYNGFNFEMPNQENKKVKLVPIPMMNAGIGLVKKTELDVRYIPEVKGDFGFAGKGSIQLWGIGLKHDLLQWVPAVGNVIPMGLSLQVGHTSLNTKFDINAAGAKQDVELDVSSTTINLIASKKVLIITAHASIGYNSSKTTFNSTTSFSLGSEDNSIDFKVPLDMHFESQNEFRTNIGLRLDLTLLKIHADHTFSKYPVTTIGIGLGLR